VLAHGHRERLRADRRALGYALGLVAGFMVVEVVVGVLADSLAVLADAGHMLSDSASLGLALFAAWLAGRPPTPRRSFGYQRAEILAALANGVALVVVAIWIFVEAGRRLADPPPVEGGWVVSVGAVGLAVNLAAAAILRRAGSGSLNVRGAAMHVLADLWGSAGVVVAGLVIVLTGWYGVDPVVAILIGLLVLASSWRLLRESVAILLEETPSGIDPEEVGTAIVAVPGVVEAHDLHIWTITSGFPALSAHVLCEPAADCHAVRRRIEGMLRERFALEHTTLQVDHAGTGKPAPVELGASYRRTSPLPHV
jgi:cobalt-zinc-cadmium efflux system protein